MALDSRRTVPLREAHHVDQLLRAAALGTLIYIRVLAIHNSLLIIRVGTALRATTVEEYPSARTTWKIASKDTTAVHVSTHTSLDATRSSRSPVFAACVNALGTTAAAIPSSTTGVIPSATPFTAADTSIVYSPSAGTWKTVDSPGNCTISNSIRVTQDVNASISFNYTGTSIMIHTVTSSIGGSVWLIVDGFNTTSSVNTLSGPDDDTRPTCYPNQYPPFVITPPGYETRQSHSLTLVYSGASPDYTGTAVPNIQFDGFSVPDAGLTMLGLVSAAGMRQKLEMLSSVWVIFLTIFWAL
ncbi:hypothetical protein D9613_009524 [Agrocybe pediades]|uniref:Uncharacterized protein n=1 Tax=Agrocybe pediades TaxID=84607 RepID=A0A8H4R2X8_9AGAR|nr:hypothetical protein D9613_009524 [Agrocybe pediades]